MQINPKPNTVFQNADSSPNDAALMKATKTRVLQKRAAGVVISKSNKPSRGFFHPPISEQISSKSAPIIKRLQGTRGAAALHQTNS